MPGTLQEHIRLLERRDFDISLLVRHTGRMPGDVVSCRREPLARKNRFGYWNNALLLLPSNLLNSSPLVVSIPKRPFQLVLLLLSRSVSLQNYLHSTYILPWYFLTSARRRETTARWFVNVEMWFSGLQNGLCTLNFISSRIISFVFPPHIRHLSFYLAPL